jgi:hypothetical protein
MSVPRRCPTCGGHFNYRTSLYEHWNDCAAPVQPASRYYSDREQDKVAATFGACPVHGLEPALDCQGCAANADADYWTPESERL